MDKTAVLQQLRGQVFAKQEVLKRIYDSNHKTSLFDYANSWKPAKLREEAAGQVEKLLERIYPKDTAAKAAGQLKKNPLVSTIDHHGILNHPFFINSNLIFSLHQGLDYLICFTTSGVSLNNSSWPASLVVSSIEDCRLKRISFYSDRMKTLSVFSTPALKPEDVSRTLNHIKADEELPQPAKDSLSGLVAGLFAGGQAYDLRNFSDQACQLSTRLWQKVFPSAPQVLYLPLEDLTSEIIRNIIDNDSTHILHRLLFTEEGWNLLEKHFQGSLGAFSSLHKGSFLFWGVGSNGRRVHLARQGNRLANHEFYVNLSVEQISSALAERKIYPTALVCFLAMLYYRITCLGGFNQVNWLTSIKLKLARLLEELGESGLAGDILSSETDNFAEGNLAFLDKNGILAKATALDIFLEGKDLYPTYKKLGEILTVGESIDSLLPEIYQVITPAPARKAEFSSITDEDIIRQSGWDKKIREILD